jgi:predicted permease
MPDWTSELRARLAPLALTAEREAEIIEELSAHLDDRCAELAATLPADEARRLALADLDDDAALAARMRELRQARAARALPPPPGAPRRRLAGDLWMDLRYAVRLLQRQPGLTAAAALTLALGIGANTALFSIVHATLLRPLPVPDVEALYVVHNGRPGAVFSYPAYADVRDGNDVFVDLAAFGGISASLNAGAETDLVSGAIVTGSFFPVLGVSALHGRVLGREDDVTVMGHPVVVVSHSLWQSRFGGQPGAVGSDVLLNGRRFTIVGVLPPGFTGVQAGLVRDFYVPMMMQPLMRPPRAGYSGEMDPSLLNVRSNSWLFAIGRLKPGVTPAQAEASLSALATALAASAQQPGPAGGGAPAGPAPPRRVPITPLAVGDAAQRAEIVSAATLLSGVVMIVLIVACANVANLLLSRAAARRPEIALRLALGADRGRLVRQLLTESLLLAVTGGVAGAGLAWLIAAAFRAAPPPPGALPVPLQFSLDWPVLGFALALATVTGIVFGLAPAIASSGSRLLGAIRSTSGATAAGFQGVRWFHARSLLVIAQIALCLALLVAAGLFLRSLDRARRIDPGFDLHRLVSVPLNVNLLRYTTAQGREFYARAVEAAEALPGVRSAAVARIGLLPGNGRMLSVNVEGRAPAANVFQSEGTAVATGREIAAANVVGPGFFATLGLSLRQGRDFSSVDGPGSARVVIVNERFVAQHLDDGAALGRRISLGGAPGPWHTVVGVAADAKYAAIDEPSTPVVYLPLSQNHETGMTLIVRADGDSAPAGLLAPLRLAIRAIEPNLPITGTRVGGEILGVSLYTERMGALLLGVFAGLALLLAAVGIYGVLSFSIARRTREVGIRLALGAGPGRVFRMIVGEGMTLVAIGVAIGAIGALAGGRFLAGFLHGVSTRDPWTLVSVPVVLAAAAAAACALPARRAMRVDPTVALRME